MTKLSVIVITKNEAHNIGECLRSVAFADEIIVVDSGSTDGTPELARAAGAKVSATADWPGFGPQKNRALTLAGGDWVLSIDADERISPQLAAEITAVLATPEFHVYSIPRLSSYCGQYMLHSGWHPDRVRRLFLRGQAQFSDDLVHERLVTSAQIGTLRSVLLHESFRCLEDVLDKTNHYSTAGAASLHRKGKTGSLGKALCHGLWAFARTYLFQRGFLDGQMGLVLALSNAQGTYYRYLKLWLLDNQNKAKLPHQR